MSVLLNSGDGTFEEATYYPAGKNPRSVFATDFDGDGFNDIAVANIVSANVSVFINYGDGTFQDAVHYGAGSGSIAAFAADFNGDGFNDIAVANSSWNNISILINTHNTINIKNEFLIPFTFTYSQNFPNPFNSSTTINFNMNEPGEVNLNVYNIQGQRVAELFRGIREVGEHSISWDASEYPSGVYFARLEAGGSSTTAKMVLLK
jgi:hypothetical protein